MHVKNPKPSSQLFDTIAETFHELNLHLFQLQNNFKIKTSAV